MALDFPSSPTNGQTYSANNITWVYETSTTTWKVKQDGATGKTRIATVKDVKAYNVDGGTFTADTWVHRTLNTLSDPNNIGLSISGNIVTIPAGTYSIRWRAPAYLCNRFTSRLAYSSTSSTVASGITYVDGTTGYSHAINGLCAEESFGDIATITFSTTTYLKIEQYSDQGYTGGTSGLGVGSYINGVESIFTTLVIEDLATTVKDNATYVEGVSRVAVLRDQKNYDKSGGEFHGDYWRDRDLTVEEDPHNFVNFVPTANGQTTESAGKTPGYWSLPAGTYEIQWGAGGFNVNRHQTRLVWSTTQSDMTWSDSNSSSPVYNSADNAPNTTSRFGTNECFGSSANGSEEANNTWSGAWSTGTKIITITETTWFKVLHISDEHDSDGFGIKVDSPESSPSYTQGKNIYAEVKITDLATAVKDNATYVEGKSKVATLQHQEAQNTDAGGFTSGAWQKRELTTESDPNNFVTFPVTGDTDPYSDWKLPAGSYRIRWSAPGYRVNAHQSRLAYDDNSSFTSPTYVMGSSEESPAVADESQTRSVGEALLTLTDTTWLRIEHKCQTSEAGNGQGHACNFATEVYTEVSIEDLATAVKNSEPINSSTNVWHVQKTDSQLIHTNPIAWTDITGLTQTVTSTSASTKFLITATVNASIVGTGSDGVVRLMRGTTVIGSTSSDGNAVSTKTGFGHVSGQNSQYQSDALCITYLDTPGVGTHTYHIEGINSDASIGMRINRRGLNEDFYLTSHMSIQRYI